MVSTFDSRTKSGIKDLELTSISKSFDNTIVLNNLSLDIYKGELCCLLGPSGCGKTTLLKIINGLLTPDLGNVILAGSEITSFPCQKRDLGMVFQNYALFPHMDVFNNVAYGLRRRRIPKNDITEKVKETLTLVRLSGYERRRIHELSGGQQQRVALARALVIEPQALLLDEPLSNLDAKLREDMRDEIRRIQRQLGITTVYVTHDQEEAMSIADRIVVMNNGKIEQLGTPQEVYHRPETRFVAEFIGKMNFIRGINTGGIIHLLGQTYNFPENTVTREGELTCAIRPERINLVTASGSLPRGIIESVTYLGSIRIYSVSVDVNGKLQELKVQTPVSQESWNVGDSVHLEIDSNNILLFRDES